MEVRKVSVLSSRQVQRLHELYQDEWWTRGRTLDDVTRMIRFSQPLFGLVSSNDELVGFARVLTDRVYKAFIFDVIVAPTARRAGLGAQLMDWILSHPDLEQVRHFELYCAPEMTAFYEEWGFSSDVGGVSLMRRTA